MVWDAFFQDEVGLLEDFISGVIFALAGQSLTPSREGFCQAYTVFDGLGQLYNGIYARLYVTPSS